ncbi:cupin domain-containing protein [Nocardia zapadnayensis]|uniref:cupin domain-containing protein n=1 Tax=Nocardia rhamnosiphila TaxID=426716 RepID=UPI00224540E9|nr:cupin domain-containing protein [Nocardia zapadnayensis]MCX0275002.1 cupin domain-containing protein [Nocardia zapadnayensis]
MRSPSIHVASLWQGEEIYRSELGTLTRLTADNFPILSGLSIKRLTLAPGAFREPHWHANATELTYCTAGRALVSVLDDGSRFSSFLVTAGEMFHIDSGALHHVENVGDTDAEFVLAFRHERPEDFGLGAAVGAMTDAVLGNTYDLPAAAFADIRRGTTARLVARRDGEPDIPPGAHFGDPHHFAVEAMSAPVDSLVGSARTARRQFWPALHDISMYSLRVREDGMREPHWHPMTAEMGYVHRGSARMTIMDPDGTLDTYTVNEGEVYFVPRAYPHHIEVVDAPRVHLLIFFDQPTPADIGYRASMSAYSRKVLAATFGKALDELPELPFTPADPLIVTRNNPLDP